MRPLSLSQAAAVNVNRYQMNYQWSARARRPLKTTGDLPDY
jgi:hypothetical protein